VIDFTTFVDRVARLAPGALTGPAEPVTYHDACQSANCLGLGSEPRRLLEDVMGHEVREMAESSVCCGFGGSFSLEHPRVAKRVLARKLANIAATGAPTVVADNPGCIMHLRGAMDARGDPTRVVHLVELMAERLPTDGEGV
jgi:Fe-S oxidoreductase